MGAAWLWLPRWPWSKRDLLGREALLRQLNLMSHSSMEDYFKDLKLSSTVTSPLEWGSLFWLMQNCLLLTGVCILLKCFWHVREALWAPSAPVRPGSLFGLPAQIRHAEGWKLSQVFATLCIFEWKQVPFLDDLEVTHTCLIPSAAGQWHRCYRLWCWILPFGPWFSLVHAMQNGELSCGMFCTCGTCGTAVAAQENAWNSRHTACLKKGKKSISILTLLKHANHLLGHDFWNESP